MSAQLGEDLLHRPGEIDAHHRTAEFRFVHDGQEMGGVVLQLLEEDALAGDLSQRLPVRRAGDPEADRQRGAMPGKPDHAHVVAEIFAAELRADAELLRELMNFLLEREIAKRMSVGPSRSRERVEIFRRGELHRLQRQLRARAADDDRQVIGRAGRRAEGENLFLQERDQAIVRQDRRRRLIEETLVGGAAALGDEQEFVRVLALGGNLDLRGQIVAGVLLLEHRERRDLAVAQVLLLVGAADPRRDGGFVAAFRPDEPALLGDDDRGSRVLAHRQHAAGGDVGVLQQIISDELVVGGRFRIVENLGELPEMAGAQQMVDVDHRLFAQGAQRLRVDHEDFAAPALARRARPPTRACGRASRPGPAERERDDPGSCGSASRLVLRSGVHAFTRGFQTRRFQLRRTP